MNQYEIDAKIYEHYKTNFHKAVQREGRAKPKLLNITEFGEAMNAFVARAFVLEVYFDTKGEIIYTDILKMTNMQS
jgi:hypothetical protein|tara:strand:+ start:6019 stop:6246 length:228 start_codon:yes stop_codon:yes gene_type:complete